MEKENFLKKIPLFLYFTNLDCLKIARIAQNKAFAKDKVIFQEGQTGNALYIILSGEVMIEKQPLIKAASGIATLHLKTGEFFGELSLFDGGPRSSTARAINETKCIVIKRELFLSLVRKNTSLAAKLFENVIRIISQRVRHTNQELMAFYEAGKILSLQYSLEQLLENVLEILTSALEAKSGIILLKNIVTDSFEVKAARGILKERAQALDIASIGIGFKALKMQEPLVIKNLAEDLEFKGLARLGYEKKTLILVPFGREDGIKGLLILSGKNHKNFENNYFTANDLNLAKAVICQIEPALQNIEFRSEEEGRQRLKRQYFVP